MLEKFKKKPSWMVDERSTYGELLEFRAHTMPDKHQQMIEVCERQARSLSELARLFSDRPEEMERWLRRADEWMKRAEEMRVKSWMYRQVAEAAQKEISELQ